MKRSIVLMCFFACAWLMTPSRTNAQYRLNESSGELTRTKSTPTRVMSSGPKNEGRSKKSAPEVVVVHIIKVPPAKTHNIVKTNKPVFSGAPGPVMVPKKKEPEIATAISAEKDPTLMPVVKNTRRRSVKLTTSDSRISPVDASVSHSFYETRVRTKRINGRKVRVKGIHGGYDRAVRVGTPVKSEVNGELVYRRRFSSYGNTAIVKTIAKGRTIFALNGHLNGFNESLREGSIVAQGDIIAFTGSTGRSSGPHLHEEYWFFCEVIETHNKKGQPIKVPKLSGRLTPKELEFYLPNRHQ